MFLWIMVFVGVLILVPSLYLLVKNYKNGKYIKRYGALTYTGFVIVLFTNIIAGKLLLDQLFWKIK